MILEQIKDNSNVTPDADVINRVTSEDINDEPLKSLRRAFPESCIISPFVNCSLDPLAFKG
jgi:hypothetical protein